MITSSSTAVLRSFQRRAVNGEGADSLLIQGADGAERFACVGTRWKGEVAQLDQHAGSDLCPS